MRYTKEHKTETRRRILNAAARLFRERGYEGAGVDAIMSEAGLTAGGFYAHFTSKEALFAEAMGAALTEARTPGARRLSSADGGDPLLNLVRGYLSRSHRDHPEQGCPLPVLTPDVARSGVATREGYERQFLKYLAEIETLLPEGTGASRDRALALVAQCVGGLMLSRAVMDEELSNRILKACRNAAMKISEE